MDMTVPLQATYPPILTAQMPVRTQGKDSTSPPSQPLYSNAEGTFYESILTLILATRIRTNLTTHWQTSTVRSRAEPLANLHTAGFQGHGVFLSPCNARQDTNLTHRHFVPIWHLK